MKKILWASLLLVVIGSGVIGCKKIIKALFPGIDVDLAQITLTIPANPIAPPVFNGTLDLPTITQHFNLDSVIKENTKNQFGISDVSSVKLKKISVAISNGANANNNLQNFENVKLSFSSNSNTTKVLLAAYDFPDTYTTTADLAPTNSPELQPYLLGSELYYNVSAKPRRATTQPLTLVINATVSVK